MSRVQVVFRALALFPAVILAGVLAAGPALAAKQAPPKVSGLKARIATGIKVDMAASGFTAEQLAALRPDFAKLKPRARTNAE